MAELFDPDTHKFPEKTGFLISDIDGVLTTPDKKAIAPGIEEKLFEIKNHGIVIIANTLRGIAKYSNIIDGRMQEIVDYGISERGAIQIGKDKKIRPMISPEDMRDIEMFNEKIKGLLISKGATEGPGPYACIKYYFADNALCQHIIQQMQDEPIYRERKNDLILEPTGQGSIILTKKGVDKGYGTVKSIGQENLSKTIILGDDIVDEAMFSLPGVQSFNVGPDKTLRSTYATSKLGHEATIEILDAFVKSLHRK